MGAIDLFPDGVSVASARYCCPTSKMTEIYVFNHPAFTFATNPSLAFLAGGFYFGENPQFPVNISSPDYNQSGHLWPSFKATDGARRVGSAAGLSIIIYEPRTQKQN